VLTIIHALGIAKCIVVNQVVMFDEFCENGSKWRSFEIGEFKWIIDVVVMKKHD